MARDLAITTMFGAFGLPTMFGAFVLPSALAGALGAIAQSAGSRSAGSEI